MFTRLNRHLPNVHLQSTGRTTAAQIVTQIFSRALLGPAKFDAKSLVASTRSIPHRIRPHHNVCQYPGNPPHHLHLIHPPQQLLLLRKPHLICQKTFLKALSWTLETNQTFFNCRYNNKYRPASVTAESLRPFGM